MNRVQTLDKIFVAKLKFKFELWIKMMILDSGDLVDGWYDGAPNTPLLRVLGEH